MRRKELSEIARRSEEELKLSRAAAERHALAFECHEEGLERVMGALDRHEAQTSDLGIFIRDMNRRSDRRSLP
jgi:hypothetical protein